MTGKQEGLRGQILDAIRDLAKSNGGKPPGRLALERATGIKESAWRGVLWARWNDAVEETGMAPNAKTTAIDENVLMANSGRPSGISAASQPIPSFAYTSAPMRDSQATPFSQRAFQQRKKCLAESAIGPVSRRVKEITVALPDAVELIHSIRTDDPPGIEAYWHRRFADRRANGEWFKLEFLMRSQKTSRPGGRRTHAHSGRGEGSARIVAIAP